VTPVARRLPVIPYPRYCAVMSHENVELLKQGVEAFNRGDMDGMLALMDPELEFVTAGLFPGIPPRLPRV
jgi:ketosteroid isomerase-like protein